LIIEAKFQLVKAFPFEEHASRAELQAGEEI
jgi:hypothetical protein